MNRFKLEELVEAYDETGITPKDGIFYNKGSHCGCPIATLLIHKKPQYKDFNWNAWSTEGSPIMDDLNVSIHYLEGFQDGFDNHHPDVEDVIGRGANEYKAGHQDGKEARKLLLGKGKKDA